MMRSVLFKVAMVRGTPTLTATLTVTQIVHPHFKASKNPHLSTDLTSKGLS